jgi:hypothetical protein
VLGDHEHSLTEVRKPADGARHGEFHFVGRDKREAREIEDHARIIRGESRGENQRLAVEEKGAVGGEEVEVVGERGEDPRDCEARRERKKSLKLLSAGYFRAL